MKEDVVNAGRHGQGPAEGGVHQDGPEIGGGGRQVCQSGRDRMRPSRQEGGGRREGQHNTYK